MDIALLLYRMLHLLTCQEELTRIFGLKLNMTLIVVKVMLRTLKLKFILLVITLFITINVGFLYIGILVNGGKDINQERVMHGKK